MWKQGTWAKAGSRKRLKGMWYYFWAADRFVIKLSGNDPETGMPRQPFQVSGDSPNFGNWKLVEPRKAAKP